MARQKDKNNGYLGVIACPCSSFSMAELDAINKTIMTFDGAEPEEASDTGGGNGGNGGNDGNKKKSPSPPPSGRRLATTPAPATKPKPPACKKSVPVTPVQTLCEPCNSAFWAAASFKCEATISYGWATVIVCALDAILYAAAGCACVMGIRKDDKTTTMGCFTRGWVRIHIEKLGHMFMAVMAGISIILFGL